MLGNVFSFSGRRGRLSYFMAWLLLTVISGAIGSIFGTLGSQEAITFTVAFVLVALWPCFAIGAQRFHDFGASGWWNLLSIVPIVGGIVFLILLFAPGNKQSNSYGPVPTTGYAALNVVPK